MRIGVPNYSGYIYQHFGRSDEFRIYDVADDGKTITKVQTLSTEGRRHGQLACWLVSLGVQVVICGGMGEGMQQLLSGLGVTICGGVMGDCDKAVQDYLQGNLLYTENPGCSEGGKASTSSSEAPDKGGDTGTVEDTRETPSSSQTAQGTLPGADDDPPLSGLEAYHDQNGKLHMPLLF